MRLREFLDMNEMALPAISSPENAVEAIRQAYNAAVLKKQPQGDHLGSVQNAMRYLQKTTAPEKYVKYVKQGSAAIKAIQAYTAKTSSAGGARLTTARDIRPGK